MDSIFNSVIVTFYENVEPKTLLIFSIVILTIGMFIFNYFDVKSYKKIIKAMGDSGCKEVTRIEKRYLKRVILFNIIMYIFSILTILGFYDTFIGLSN